MAPPRWRRALSPEKPLAAWLDVEVALAKAQAELGIQRLIGDMLGAVPLASPSRHGS